MITIVGLGNPDKEYEKTRHNVGRILVESLRKNLNFEDFEVDKKRKALISKGKMGKEKAELILPETYMNNSGKSLGFLAGKKKQIENLIVFQDDLDLPIGKAKMVFNRGSGGHKGIESLARALKSKAFVRVKIGISKKTAKLVDFYEITDQISTSFPL